jgi:hypothetical protein
MTYAEVVAWTLSVADRVKRGQGIEDSLVELKREWIQPVRFARRLAGHANAAGGSDVLWIIGLDEKEGVIGDPKTELAEQLEPMFAQFAGPHPGLIRDAAPEVDGKTLRALLFSTDRRPYVVKNPAFNVALPAGSPPNPVEREVPWREGTMTRSATHEDLIRILAPLSAAPEWEIRSVWLTEGPALEPRPGHIYLTLYLGLYVDCPRDIDFSIPFHRCEATLMFPGQPAPIRFPKVNNDTNFSSSTIEATESGVHVRGPGVINLAIHGEFDLSLVGKTDAEFSLTMHARRVMNPMRIGFRLKRVIDEGSPRSVPAWEYELLEGEKT